jgi:hypothetical protein
MHDVANLLLYKGNFPLLVPTTPKFPTIPATFRTLPLVVLHVIFLLSSMGNKC